VAQLGTDAAPLRVAIIGSGPAAFYVAERLLKEQGTAVAVDMYERLPTPFGLVRFGVAPDHQKIKQVTRVFEKAAGQPAFRFYGNVEYGRHVTLADLHRHYHQICFATGAQTDRRLGIPGEDLAGSHPATEFVAWYNGHPDFRDCTFDLSGTRVAVIGVGNVAVDVARILCRTSEELAATDIADYALEALARSSIREVSLIGRRGPAQAAFTNPEARELGQLPGADIQVVPEEIALDDVSRAALAEDDTETQRKLAILQEFVGRPPAGKPRRLSIRFKLSPVEILGDDRGHVRALRLVKNALVQDGDRIRAVPTDTFEEMPVDLVFRSVGYLGVPLPGLPFDEKRGTVPNEAGRVIDPATGGPVPGCYVSGWIKRGPTGVIGTNKPDGKETAEAMLADAAAGRTLPAPEPEQAACERTLARRRARPISYLDWRRIDEAEVGAGAPTGRPRVKLTSLEEVLALLDGTPAGGGA